MAEYSTPPGPGRCTSLVPKGMLKKLMRSPISQWIVVALGPGTGSWTRVSPGFTPAVDADQLPPPDPGTCSREACRKKRGRHPPARSVPTPVRHRCSSHPGIRRWPRYSPSAENSLMRPRWGSSARSRSPSHATEYKPSNSPGPSPLRPKVNRWAPSRPNTRISLVHVVRHVHGLVGPEGDVVDAAELVGGSCLVHVIWVRSRRSCVSCHASGGVPAVQVTWTTPSTVSRVVVTPSAAESPVVESVSEVPQVAIEDCRE